MRTLLVVLAACGSSGPKPDAAPANCDFSEASDGTNDKTAEDTGLSLGTTTKTICGGVQGGHFDDGLKTVDIDTYRVTVDSSELLVRFYGGSGVESIGELSALVFDTAASPTLLAGASIDQSLDHGAYFTSLTPGTYDVVVVAKNAADVAGFDYKVRISADPAERCDATLVPKAKVAYTEAGETAGNDVVAVTLAASPQFQATTGTAEATNLTLDPLKKVWIQGSSDAGDAPDDYMDRDTYEITTGKQTNELSVRLGWTAQGPDLDFLAFEEGMMKDVGDGLTSSPMGGEYATFAVKPSSKYWIWVGSHDGSTGLPAMYDLSVCGTRFVADQAR